MAEFKDICLEHVRSRRLRHDWRRYIRPHWERSLKPGWEQRMKPGDSLEADLYHQLKAESDRKWRVHRAESQEELAAERAADEAYQAELARLRWLVADLKLDLALQRFKRKYSPDQPRVPAGNPDGGQWTSGGGTTREPRIRLAGPLPTNDPPEVPKERPPTAQERNRAARSAARWISRYGGTIGKVAAGAYWLYEEYPSIKAYQDPPKTLEELQGAVSAPQKGYNIHHIVEQTSAEQDGFPRSQIDASDNKVRIPTYKHWEINAWFQAKNDEYGGLSPRDYLRDKDWDERVRVGRRALIDHGVLKP